MSNLAPCPDRPPAIPFPRRPDLPLRRGSLSLHRLPSLLVAQTLNSFGSVWRGQVSGVPTDRSGAVRPSLRCLRSPGDVEVAAFPRGGRPSYPVLHQPERSTYERLGTLPQPSLGHGFLSDRPMPRFQKSVGCLANQRAPTRRSHRRTAGPDSLGGQAGDSATRVHVPSSARSPVLARGQIGHRRLTCPSPRPQPHWSNWCYPSSVGLSPSG